MNYVYKKCMNKKMMRVMERELLSISDFVFEEFRFYISQAGTKH
jgi:hypothetical protein